MRVLAIVKANEKTEAGEMPTEGAMSAMMKFNEELVNAGVIKDGDGVYPTSRSVRIVFGSGGPTVRKGPFTPATEQLAGYWIWEVGSLDEAVEWGKKAPFENGDQLELRPYFTAEDFGEALTPEIRAAEETLRGRAAQN